MTSTPTIEGARLVPENGPGITAKQVRGMWQELTMAQLHERVLMLEEAAKAWAELGASIKKLTAAFNELAMRLRQSALMDVDAFERLAGVEPTTADLRKETRKR